MILSELVKLWEEIETIIKKKKKKRLQLKKKKTKKIKNKI